MMNQKGFATILALCFLLVVTFVARGIQDSERNHIHETESNAVAEFELQNAADSAILMAVDDIRENRAVLPKNTIYPAFADSRDRQIEFETRTFHSANIGDITVRTWGERIEIHKYKVAYNGEDDENNDDSTTKNKARRVTYGNKIAPPVPSYIFFSLAEATNPKTGRKIYRRAHAYVPFNDDDTFDPTEICFTDTKQSDYDFED